MNFTKDFLTAVASELVTEVAKAKANGNRPYAASLFRVPHGEQICLSHKIQSAYNQSAELRDHNGHAELLLLMTKVIARELYDNWFSEIARQNRPTYCLFVNAPPCPMCMGAILNAQVLYTVYFVETPLPLHPRKLAEAYRSKNAFVVRQGEIEVDVYEQLKRQISDL